MLRAITFFLSTFVFSSIGFSQTFYYHGGQKKFFVPNKESVHVIYEGADLVDRNAIPVLKQNGSSSIKSVEYFIEDNKSRDIKNWLQQNQNIIAIEPMIGSVPVSNLF